MIQNVLSIRHTTVLFDNICFEIALRIILRYGGETTPNDVSCTQKITGGIHLHSNAGIRSLNLFHLLVTDKKINNKSILINLHTHKKTSVFFCSKMIFLNSQKNKQ